MEIEPVVQPSQILFLSASVPHRSEWLADARPIEIEEAIISLARAVFARGGRLLFGGHPSISPLVAAVAGEYFAVDPSRQVRPVITFQSKFFAEKDLPNKTWEMYRMGWADIEWTPIVMRKGVAHRDDSLERMRNGMLLNPQLLASDPEAQKAIKRIKLSAPKAMVAIGGMEGVAEEAGVFLECRKMWPELNSVATKLPGVYPFKSGGGAASRLVEAPETFENRLWPAATPPQREGHSQRLAILQQARQANQLNAVEDMFNQELIERGSRPTLVGEEKHFEPYAALSQWLVQQIGIT
jgi:hypothetical protein